ncbi:unnamed protein product [Parnassius apollo]|uniref:(apollo) hypothetical protein n=1 Tax=Parnassius apollo TaxID=110799 RepID=A0A8S3W0E4_PARAO|nr:unnamed protein product [Parnassius apollo]
MDNHADVVGVELERSQERDTRQGSDHERHAVSRALETLSLTWESLGNPEERETRLSADRSQHALARSLETDEQREQRNELARQRYHDMRVEVSLHSTQERERIQEIRASQSAEQRVDQIDLDRIHRNLCNSSSSDIESMVYDPEEQPWFNKEWSAFSYNPFINYIEHGDIGTTSEVCAHCHARKWKEETKGMCWASGKYPTYRAACVARHLLDGDQHWDNALKEASISDSPSRLRHLFAVMFVFCGFANPLLLWEKYRHLLSEDFLRAPRCTTGDNTESTDERVLNSCLSSLQDMVISIGGSFLVDYGLPTP